LALSKGKVCRHFFAGLYQLASLGEEILKEAVEYAAEKKWIARSPLLPGDSQ